MSDPISRRAALQQFGAAGAGLALSRVILGGGRAPIVIGGVSAEIAIASVSPSTVRITIRAIDRGGSGDG